MKVNKMNDIGSKAKNFIHEEKEVLSNFGTKALEEVESITADVFKEIGRQVSEFTSRTLHFIRKNPVIATAAVVTIGLVIAKMVNKPQETHKSKKMAH